MTKISAWAAPKQGDKLKPFGYERNLKSIDILVEIKYCSLTRGDVRFIDNFWGDVTFPMVPGLEIIGAVKDIGKEVTGFKKGDIVGIGYQVESCFKCEFCLKGKEQFCVSQKLIPVNDFGGFADQIIIDHRFVFKMPKNLQSPSSTPLLCAGLTPFAAIKKAEVKKGMNVGVVGIGSLGHLAVQFLAKMGCHVTAFTHSKQKENILKKLGAEKVMISTDENELKKIEKKYDFILSTSSEPVNWELYVKALKPEGMLCFVGLPLEKVSFKAELLADYAQRKIMGNYIGSRRDMADMLEFASAHNIQAMVETFPMNKVNEAIEKMKTGKIPFSCVLTND